MANGPVTKIYDLKTLGYDEVHKNLAQINKDFAAIKKTKLELAGSAAAILAAQGEESEAYKKAALAVQEASQKELELLATKKQLTNEAKAQQIARQEEINSRRAEKASVVDAIGSYNALKKELSQLYALVKAAPAGSAIVFNGQTLQADEAIAKLKLLTTAEQDFRRQFQRDGLLVAEYTSGIVQAFKKMGLDDLVGGQVTKAGQRINELDRDFEALKAVLNDVKVNGAQSLETLQTRLNTVDAAAGKSEEQFIALDAVLKQASKDGVVGLEAIERQLIQNRKEQIQLNSTVGELRNELRGSGDIGNQITKSLSEGFKSARQQLGQLVLGYIGFQAVFSGIVQGVETAKDLSDQTTNLEVELGKAKGGAEGLVGAIAKLDTRTKLTTLEDIANIAAKAGVSEKELTGVTAAIDKIKIAFGKDFGDVEQGTESLVKLVNIFLGTDQVTGDNLLRVGNSIRTLANESVASVPFINDFSKRMAGLKGISDISLPAVLGLASGFEQFGQTAEVSSTALVRIIPKLASDTQKFAAVAGVTQQQFSDLLKSNPAEALIKVAQGFTAGKSSIEEFEASFKDSGLGNGRVSSVIGVLGKNADTFRQSITSAGKAFNDTGNLTAAFEAKNNNLAASLDKVSKKFSDAANSKTFQLTLLAIATALSFLLTNLPILLTILGLLAVSWSVQNSALLLLRAQTIGYNIAIGASYAAMAILTVIQSAYNAVLFITNGALGLVTRALAFFNITVKASSGPLGIILTIIGLAAAAYAAFGRSLASATVGINDFLERQRISNEVTKQATAAIADQKSQLDVWISIIKNASASADTKRLALEKLIAINPAFRDALQGQTIDLKKLDAAYAQVITSIRAKAEAEAAAQLSAEKQKQVLQITTLRQTIENEFAGQKRDKAGATDVNGLSKEEINTILEGVDQQSTTLRENGSGGVSFFNSDFSKVIDDLKRKEDTALNKYQQYLSVQAQKQAQLLQLEQDSNKKQLEVSTAAGVAAEIDIAALKAKLDALDKQIETFRGSRTDLNKLVKERSDAQDALDRALGNAKGSKPTRDKLDATDANSFKDIEATRDLLLAQEKLKRTQDQEDEQTYLSNILKINQDAIDKKLSLLKGANNEERRVAAELQLDRITQEQETNKKLFELKEKQVKDEFDSAKKNADSTAAEVTNNPSSDELQRAQAKLDADRTILTAQQVFNAKMDELEKAFAQKSKKNAQERADALRSLAIALGNATIAVTKASLDKELKDSEDSAVKSIDEIKATIAQKTVDILSNNKLTDRQKAKELNKLEQQGNIDVLANEVAALRIQLPIYQDLLEKKFITQKQYSDKYLELKNKEAALIKGQSEAEATGIKEVGNALKDGVKSILLGLQQFKTKKEAIDAAVNDALSIVKDTIKKAEEDYFQNLTNRVDAEKDASRQILDVQKQQELDHAQTEGEKASIEKKFALQSQKLEEQASEKKKQIALKKMAIDFGVAVIKTLAEYPFPFSLIPVAALSLQYFLNRSAVQNQKFEKGGQLGDVPTTGGPFGGQPHSQGGTPFSFKGQQFEAEVNELAIVRTKNTPRDRLYQVAGTQAQIASAMNVVGGGRQFAPGAKMQRFDFGGHLGESLQPPVFSPTTGSQVINAGGGGISEEKFEQMVNEIKGLAAEQSARIDRLQVQQVTSSVTTAQNKIVKQKGIGTL